ncbi:MAG: hypothetical protein LBI69_04490, partial [Puniceicoccales bacterium]|nr:hypothetical protein [Puniceicoccales bacterium]
MSSNLLQRSIGSSSTPSHYQSIDNGDKVSHHRNVASKAINAIVEHILTFIKKLTANRDGYKQFSSSEIMKCKKETEDMCNKFEDVDKAELRKNFIVPLLCDKEACSTAFFASLLQCSEFKDDITDERMINIYTLFEQKNIIGFFRNVDLRKVESFFSQSIDSIETILSQDAGTIKDFFDEKLETIEYVMQQKKEDIPGVCSAIASPQRGIAIACIENQKHKNCKLNGSIFSKLAESEKNIHILDQKELYCNGFAPIVFDESYKKEGSYVQGERFMNSPVANQGGALSNIDALFAPETSEEEIEQIMENAAIVQFQDMNRNGFTKIIIGGKAIEMPLEPRKKSTHFI